MTSSVISREVFLKTGILITEVDIGQKCNECHTCIGFETHVWRKVCNNCKCPRESHDVYHEEFVDVRQRLGLKNNDCSCKEKTLQEGYSWVPPGIISEKIEQYFSQLPLHKVPRLGTPGEKYRDRQLILQLPKQDLALAYCKFLEHENWKHFEDFVNNRNELALDIGYIRTQFDKKIECQKCKKSIGIQDIGVIAPKFGEQVSWHPNCFCCSVCEELLVDLTYCAKDGKLFCERHYAETIKPRCSACDELIFSGEYTKAMSKDWHSGHFCCWQCDVSLTGQRYVLREDHPFCVKCFEQIHANVCEECTKPIGIDAKDLAYKEKHWHDDCFVCFKCKKSLIEQQFGTKSDHVYCGDCYDVEFAYRCDGCGDVFKAGTKKMEYKGKQWHESCFACFKCQVPIGNKAFVPRENDILCTDCFEVKYATRCVKCSEIIHAEGLTYKNEPWHRSCFVCVECALELASVKFSVKDDKTYCRECFGNKYAPKCAGCQKPIISKILDGPLAGSTKFITFEDRNWHDLCFKCNLCHKQLENKGFIVDGPDLMCSECAKLKFQLS